MIRPQAVLFDMDGVLVETFDAWVAVLDAARAARGMSALGPDGVQAVWGQGIEADARDLFDGENVADLAREYDERFAQHLDKVFAIDGARELVQAVRTAGCRTAVVTNSPRLLAEQLLGAVDLQDAFEFVNCGDEVPRGKPDPALIHLALERLNLPAHVAVMIGDTPLDVQAARAAGVASIGFRVDADSRIESLAAALSLLELSSS